MDFAGRVVLVTGASSGIGRVTALAFAHRGATVVGVARREAPLEELAEACRAHAPASGYLAGDLGERGFAERAVSDTVARHGRLDVLVNNAALAKHKHLYHTTPEEVRRVMDVNFMACVWTTLAAIPPMLARREGWIVNVSSFAARVVPPREPFYAASKAALDAFTEGLWNELQGSGIHAGLVVPGPIDTEIWQKQEEPNAYRGPRHAPEIVTEAVFEVIEKRRHQVMAPKRSLPLLAARFLRLVFPSLLRLGVRRMDPVPPELIERARARARDAAAPGN